MANEFSCKENQETQKLKKGLVDAFEKIGVTTHAGRAEALGMMVNHCIRKRIPFTLVGVPGKGYGLYIVSETEAEKLQSEMNLEKLRNAGLLPVDA